MIKLRLKNDILKSVFYMHFLYFYIYIYIYIKISKHLLAKYYQENKATLQKKKKKLVKDIKVFLKKKKKSK